MTNIAFKVGSEVRIRFNPRKANSFTDIREITRFRNFSLKITLWSEIDRWLGQKGINDEEKYLNSSSIPRVKVNISEAVMYREKFKLGGYAFYNNDSMYAKRI